MRKSTPRVSASAVGPQGGESVRVCVRTRPLNQKQRQSGSRPCIQTDNSSLQITTKGVSKSYRYHRVFGESFSQSAVFSQSGAPLLLDSALQGYSASIFAYGQTGSGKTYTMAGKDQALGQSNYVSDQTDGIIPRAISYLWQSMARKQEQFYVKAAFMEIYNEQLRDLLHPSSGVLHCRWNIKSGFFVEDLLIVDCTSIDDLIAVMHEGIRNRKKGVHQLNNDSSRSHSILIVYLISEMKTEDGHSFKKFGKISFVDLAGSQRLKQTKSKGVMVKQTGNINRSLFTLGKVISALGGKTKGKSHIPYRDSKLTMLLMDSLGGTSKALMIACVTPADTYAQQTLSTLNYAARTMNIQNKPVVQMDSKEQVVFNLRKEIELLKMENGYLKEQLYSVNGGIPASMPDINRKKSHKLPPIPHPPQNQQPTYILEEYQSEIQRLQHQNTQLAHGKEVLDKLQKSVIIENSALSGKLNNLEHVFTDYSGQQQSRADRVTNQYAISNLINENSNIKRQLSQFEQEKAQMRMKMSQGGTPRSSSSMSEFGDVFQIKQANTQLQKRIEFLQKREKDLLEHLIKAQSRIGKQWNILEVIKCLFQDEKSFYKEYILILLSYLFGFQGVSLGDVDIGASFEDICGYSNKNQDNFL